MGIGVWIIFSFIFHVILLPHLQVLPAARDERGELPSTRTLGSHSEEAIIKLVKHSVVSHLGSQEVVSAAIDGSLSLTMAVNINKKGWG